MKKKLTHFILTLETLGMKNIDVEKLKAEIKRLEEMDYPCDTLEQSTGFYDALDRIKSFIDSFQQEQPEVDLEKIIQKTYHDGSVADTSDMDHVDYEKLPATSMNLD